MKHVICLVLVLTCLCRCGGSLPSAHHLEIPQGDRQNTSGTQTGEADNTDATPPSSPSSSLLPPSLLVINEIFYDAVESDTDGHAFVELYGTSDADISGYVIRFVNGADGKKTGEIVLKQGSRIPDDGYFVVADGKTGQVAETFVANADTVANFDPQNGPDSVQLFSPQGELLDVVGYGEGMMEKDGEGHPLYEGSPAFDAPEGQSLSRVGVQDTGNNHEDFVVLGMPSPGISKEEIAQNTPEENGADENIPDNDLSQDAESLPDFVSRRETVYFTEIVVDAQQDWNDTESGNGVAFDSVAGDGAIGTTDEWIEIHNGRNEAIDLSQWHLQMVDGTDEEEIFGSTAASMVFSMGGTTNNFLPDEFLIVGNPAGDMKNTVTLRLLDEQGLLVDEVVVDDGNAGSIDDESLSLSLDGEWKKIKATIGY